MSRLPALLLSIAAAAPASALAGPAQFSGELAGVDVARHTVAVSPGTTWTFQLDTAGSAAPHLFVSTRPHFAPHDADCAGAEACTVDVEDADTLYVFVMSQEGRSSYRLTGDPARAQARR